MSDTLFIDNLPAIADVQARTLVPERALEQVPHGVMEFEMEMRRGPRWRCSHCGWLAPWYWWEFAGSDCALICESCGQAAVQRYTRGPVGWPPVVAGPARTWALALAERCEVPLVPAGQEQQHLTQPQK